MNLDRILNAVERRPIDLDRIEYDGRPRRAHLLDQLKRAGAWYRIARAVKTRPTKRQALAAQIVKKAAELRPMVEAYMTPRRTIHGPRPHGAHLDWLISDVKDDLMFVGDITKMKFSANEYLVAMLQGVFERFFHEPATFTRDEYAGRVKGPFIDFAEAIFDELKISRFTRDSIARALTKVRKARKG